MTNKQRNCKFSFATLLFRHILITTDSWACQAHYVIHSGRHVANHDDVIKLKHFPHYWSFVRGIHRSPVNSPRRHQIETFSALLVLCEGNSPVTGEFPSQRPATRSLDVFFDLHFNKRLCKQSRRRLFETQSRSSWCRYNDLKTWGGRMEDRGRYCVNYDEQRHIVE